MEPVLYMIKALTFGSAFTAIAIVITVGLIEAWKTEPISKRPLFDIILYYGKMFVSGKNYF